MVTVLKSAINETDTWYHCKFLLKYQSSVEYILGITDLKEYRYKKWQTKFWNSSP
jgi:hypothetical protein